MAKSMPSEADLGLEPTEDEIATSVATAGEVDDGDISLADDPPEPEQKQAETKPEGKEADKPPEDQKTVDLRALQEARAESREAKRQAALIEQRLNDVLAAMQAPKQPQQQEAPKNTMPGPEDPVARLNWTAEQLAAMQRQREEEAQATQEQQRAQQEWQQTFARVDADYTAAATADPTISQALDRLRESQGKELLAMGLSIPEAQAELSRIEQQHIAYVAQRGLDIGQYIKALATARGWQPTAAPGQQQAKTDVAAVAAAQQRHQSLSDAPGGEVVAPLDAKALAKMDDKAFRKWLSQRGNDAKLEEILGA